MNNQIEISISQDGASRYISPMLGCKSVLHPVLVPKKILNQVSLYTNGIDSVRLPMPIPNRHILESIS